MNKTSRIAPRVVAAALAVLGIVAASGCQPTKYVHVGEKWAALEALSPGQGIEVSIDYDRPSYRIGEAVLASVRSTRDGQVWVLSVGPADEVSVLYPTGAEDNAIQANRPLRLPPSGSAWRVAAPAGPHMLVAIVVPPATTLDGMPEELPGDPGRLRDALAGLESWGAGHDVAEVKE